MALQFDAFFRFCCAGGRFLRIWFCHTQYQREQSGEGGGAGQQESREAFKDCRPAFPVYRLHTDCGQHYRHDHGGIYFKTMESEAGKCHLADRASGRIGGEGGQPDPYRRAAFGVHRFFWNHHSQTVRRQRAGEMGIRASALCQRHACSPGAVHLAGDRSVLDSA